ncbi:hypothetical protein [Streptomyces globisporus]|uniref:hypothetical protein n=1 Tax=Streptomyces globisporus TaxID=1908 RepID=UPI0005E52D2B|nr:hypothetical protein [Streptomyces globisporus]
MRRDEKPGPEAPPDAATTTAMAGPGSTRPDTTTTVDRGRFPDAVTPWEDPVWRAEALAWVTEGLAAHGLA